MLIVVFFNNGKSLCSVLIWLNEYGLILNESFLGLELVAKVLLVQLIQPLHFA